MGIIAHQFCENNSGIKGTLAGIIIKLSEVHGITGGVALFHCF